MERRRIRAEKSDFLVSYCSALYWGGRVWRGENASTAER